MNQQEPRPSERSRRRQRLDPATARIAIVGSGLTALSAALLLERHGFAQVAVYERDPSLHARKEGYGLTLTYSLAGILHRLGALDDVADADCPSRSHYLFQSDGTILGYFGNAFARERRRGCGQRGNLRVPRQQVREILLSKLQTSKVFWDHKVVRVAEIIAECDKDTQSSVELQFENRTTITADVLIAADGIRSTVVQTALPKAPTPQSLGIRVILGLTTAECSHELLHERGFYTLHPGMRLFVMPYSGSALGRSLNPDDSVRFMWQLSFVDDGHTGNDLRAEALARTESWHEPVQSLIRATPEAEIWGTLLRDRDPRAIAAAQARITRIIVAGDALHAMSPFKGQGANQCLQDGAVIAKWLIKASVEAAVRGCMREMVQRTAPVVAASRQAALFWHSDAALAEKHKFTGVDRCNDVSALLDVLHRRSIDAQTQNLDETIRCVLKELELRDPADIPASEDDDGCSIDPPLVLQALQAASDGALGKLRELSWNYPNLLRAAVDDRNGSTVLHLAAKGGHLKTVHWLANEAGCDCTTQDGMGRTPAEVANDPLTRQLLSVLRNRG
jgi:2-polyprenyl-6-methoxyphenol hydroxylase-like FAD-dependent oxidoreductase